MNNGGLFKLTKRSKSRPYDERLNMIIKAAVEAIEEEGILLGDSAQDQNLVLMYAAWLWRKRDSGDGMPRMIRYALNNRLFAQRSRG